MRNQVFKKLFSVLLALIMVAGLLPASAMAGGWGAMDVDTTPELTETEQPAEPTPEQGEPVAEPTPEQGEPTAEPVPTQGEPTAEPTDEGIMPANVMPVQANVAARDTSKDPFYRIVHLDCGRKYFSVENIKKLIDEMVKYKYNQLELAFGNDGFRFILDEKNMDLSYDDGNGSKVKKSGADVVAALKAGNGAYTGSSDSGANKYLTEADMQNILDYAKGKVDIVPLLNMPGHAKAMVSQFSGYYTSDYSVNLSNTEAKNYALAMLQKYVDWFKGKVNFFSFGADEYNSYYHDCNTVDAFVAECTDIIINAGMTPRAFNDSVCYDNKTNCGANINKALQICHWAEGWSGYNTSKASTIKSAGFPLINTNGSWYYVLKPYSYKDNGQTKNNDDSSKYYCNTEKNYAIELPTLKCASNYPTVDTYAVQGGSETVTGGKGVMFCIWCDQYDALTDSEVISDAEYGALTQIRALAKEYWGKEITTDPETTPTPTSTPDPTIGETVNVDLIVGDEINGSKTFDVVGEMTTNSNVNIATAEVKTGEATAASVNAVTSIESGKKYLIEKTYTNTNYKLLTHVRNTRSGYDTFDTLKMINDGATPNSVYAWEISASGTGYTVKAVNKENESYNGKYLTIAANTASLQDSSTVLYLEYLSEYDGWTIATGTDTTTAKYLNQLGGTDADTAGGYSYTYNGSFDTGNLWKLYEITEASDGGSKLTITATGEGDTTVKVGNTTYSITVTAPEKTETVTVAPSSSVTLTPTVPADGTVTYTLEDGNNEAGVTLAETGVVTTGEKTGNAIVKAVVKNAGEKVVARYTYTITVSDIDWANVNPLPVELWVTNLPIGKDENSNTQKWNDLNVHKVGNTTTCTPASIKLQPKDVYAAGGEAGVELLSQVIAEGVAFDGDGNVATYKNEPIKYVYWKGVVLQNGLKQYHGNSANSHDDCSDKGIDFEMIRCTADGWQYYANGEWNPVKDNDTLIAYYMQKFVVSNEVTTTTRDWGNIAGDGGATDSGAFGWAQPAPTGYFGVGYAVVYGDKSMSPSDEQGIWDKTLQMRYCYDPNVKSSDPGYILAYDTENYKITKVTITRGYHADSNGNKITTPQTVWEITDTVLWDKATNDAGTQWYDETVIWNAETGTRNNHNAIVLDSNIWGNTWVTKQQNNEAFLILFYVEEVKKDTNLNVVYWDDNAKKQINPKDIQISVKDGVNYLHAENGLKNVNPLQAGTIELPDNAYIINSAGEERYFNKDITIIDGVASNYRSGIYKYVSADISNDGKTLTLHYDLKQGAGKTFVVDFGLPVAIPFSEFGIESDNAVISFSAANSNMLERDGEYGHGKIDKTNKVVIYTLTETIDNKIAIPVYMYDENEEVIKENGEPKALTVYVIPATNVYYEDSFAKFTNGSYNGSAIAWEDAGTKPQETPTQALEALGNKTNVYGYDDAYKDSTMFSMGSARKVTVTNDMAKDGVVWPTAQFTFKGTGFDIISLTDNTSGAIFVDVVNKETGKKEKSVFVDNYYGYTYDATNGWKPSTSTEPNALYQIPVIAVRGLGYAEYNVVIKVAYSEYFDHTTPKGSYSFWLDAVRVYDPMGVDNDIYNTGNEKEGYPQYIKLRNELAKDAATRKGVVFIDGAANANIVLYANYGPNNEVYLAKGQAITFELNVGDSVSIKTIQIAAKAPNGEAYMAVTGDENHSKAIGTATEMYYELDENARTFTIANTGEGILSLTNVKITYAEKATVELGSIDTKAEENAVQAVRALFAPAPVEPEPEPEPEKTFEPERFEASWSRNVMQGRKATLTVKTSEDVEAITVDGQTIRSYRTRTERVGFGRRAKRITYREFTYSMVAQESADFSVTAINAEGTESEAITARLTVKTRPNSMRDMWDWFKGWF